MKNYFLLIGAIIMMMVSCTNEEILQSEEVNDNAEPTFTIIATQGEDNDSRIAYNPSTDGKTINLTWATGDVIYVCEVDEPTNFVELSLTDGVGTNRGTFSTTETLPSGWNQNTDLVAYYKANGNMYFAPSGYSEVWFYHTNYTEKQVQTANENMNHLKKVNYMKSESFKYETNTINNLHFSHQGAIMQFKLSGLGGKTVKELKLVMDDGSLSLAKSNYDYLYGFDYDTFSDTYMSSTSLFFDLDQGNGNYSGITLGAGESLTAYLMLGATEKTEGKTMTLTATTTDGSYIASVTGDKLEAGKLYTIEKNVTVHTPYVTFKAAGEQKFTLKKLGNYTLDNSLQYSVGDGGWSQLNLDTEITFGGSSGNLRLRGKSSTGTADCTTNQEVCAQVTFSNNTLVACSGDIRTLVDWENYTTVSTANASFRSLFQGCSQLVSAPDLPATDLAPYCYSYMFNYCENLTTAPVLPATTLSNYCYFYMFAHCYSLNNVTMLATNIGAFNLLNWLYNVASVGVLYVASEEMKTNGNITSNINAWTIEVQ